MAADVAPAAIAVRGAGFGRAPRPGSWSVTRSPGRKWSRRF